MQAMRRLSGTHLTIIIVAAMVCLALPVTAVGAGVAKVAIAGSNGKTAKVKAGKLQVEAAIAGTIKTSQQGTVTAQESSPSSFYYNIVFRVQEPCVRVAQAPAGSALLVDKIATNVWQIATPGIGSVVRVYRSADCSGDGTDIVFSVNPPGVGPQIGDYDPGLPVPAAGALYAQAGNGVIAEVQVFGHRVPAAQVSAIRPGPAQPGAQQN